MAAAPPTAVTAMPAPAPKLARTMARMIQAPASPMAPADRDRVPSGVPDSPRSWMMRASMGKAVMEMAAPMNNMAWARVARSLNRPGVLSSHGVISTDSRNGAAVPAKDTAAALFA